MCFFISVCLYGRLHWQIFIIPASSLGWRIFNHGQWSFWCALGFSLQVFYLILLHQYSWEQNCFVILSLLNLCVIWVSEWLWPYKMNLIMFLPYAASGRSLQQHRVQREYMELACTKTFLSEEVKEKDTHTLSYWFPSDFFHSSFSFSIYHSSYYFGIF